MPQEDETQKTVRAEARKREDLGLVLGALLGRPVTDCSEWLAADLKTFAKETHPIVIGGALKDLQLPKGAPIFVGGGGIVFRVERSNVPGLYYALKIGRPSVVYSDEESAENVAEFVKHSALSHENVARLQLAGVRFSLRR